MALKVIELFGGIGACSNALRRLNIPHEVVDYVEIDKYAVKSYNAIYGTNFEPQDIRKWDKDIEADLIMHGSPCQDFSIAGKQAGGDEGSGTRSSLMYETLRIVSKLRPKYVVWENVKNLLGKTHRHNFDAYIQYMQSIGYNSYYEVLNAKDFGVPQNRERVITISIRNDGLFDSYYIFPDKEELHKCLRDIMEEQVDEEYFLTDEQMARIKVVDHNSPIGVNQVAQMYGFSKEPNPQADRIYGTDGISPAMDTCSGGNRMPKVAIKTANVKGYDEATDGDGIDLCYPDSKTRRGRVGHGVAKTICAVAGCQGVLDGVRIRKLTPKECWRLMGFSDEDYEKAAKVNSNSQLYKQAGNSIVVDVLCAVFNNLFKEVK